MSGARIENGRVVVDANTHIVTVTDGRVDCVPGCPNSGTVTPHVHEFRAPDVNPNRA